MAYLRLSRAWRTVHRCGRHPRLCFSSYTAFSPVSLPPTPRPPACLSPPGPVKGSPYLIRGICASRRGGSCACWWSRLGARALGWDDGSKGGVRAVLCFPSSRCCCWCCRCQGDGIVNGTAAPQARARLLETAARTLIWEWGLTARAHSILFSLSNHSALMTRIHQQPTLWYSPSQLVDEIENNALQVQVV